MPDHPEAPVDAGQFVEWLDAMRAVLRGERDADVPCGSCLGCCSSSYPIPLRIEDEHARAEVPEAFLIGPALPDQRWLMGFREDGTCPFLLAGQCSIYSGRPRTCRDYDCRIFAAAELLPDGDRPLIHERIRAWRFDFASPAEREAAEAVREAARFIQSNHGLFPPAMRAASPTAAAVMAVKVYALFVPGAAATAVGDAAELARRVCEAAADFDRQPGEPTAADSVMP